MNKIAATVVLAILMTVVFSNIGSDVNLAFIYWLFYTLACGLIINFRNDGHNAQLFMLSIPSPMVLIFATFYRAMFHGIDNCWLSGIECKLDFIFTIKCFAFFAASVFFIWLFSYLSDWLINLVIIIFKLPKSKAKAIRERIIWLGVIVTVISGFAIILAHGWRR